MNLLKLAGIVGVGLCPLEFVTVASTAKSGEPALQGKPNPSKSIQEGLAWLARHQNEDGSWGGMGLKKRCPAEKPCFESEANLTSNYDEGLTGLALVCFLRAGHLPGSTVELADPLDKQRHKVGEVVRRGLAWLESLQKESGSFMRTQSFVYNEAIASLAVFEAYRLTRDEGRQASAKQALQFLVQAQRPNPAGTDLWGWHYAPRSKAAQDELSSADTSATGWVVTALAGAKAAGLEVEQVVFDGAVDFLDSVSFANGLVGYERADHAGLEVQGPGDNFDYHVGTMSALGILIRLNAGVAPTHTFFEHAAQYSIKDVPGVSADKLSVDYYYWYQGSLALNRLEDSLVSKKAKKKYADAWNKALIESACRIQDHTKERCSFGGWTTGDRWSRSGGPVYCTAINVLSLQVCSAR